MENSKVVQTEDFENQPTTSASVNVAQPDIKYNWRFESSVVAYIDLVVGALSLAIFIPGAIALTYLGIATDHLHWNETFHEQVPFLKEENWNIFLGLAFATVYIAIFVNIVEIWAANHLRTVTSVNRAPKEALPKVRVWMRVNLVVLIFSYLSLIQGYSRWSAVIWVLFRSARVVVVHLHVRELREYEAKLNKKVKYDPNNPKVTITIVPAT